MFWKGFILNVYYIQSVKKGAKEGEDIDVWSAIRCSYLDFYPKKTSTSLEEKEIWVVELRMEKLRLAYKTFDVFWHF